jgi:hypothetical protein
VGSPEQFSTKSRPFFWGSTALAGRRISKSVTDYSSICWQFFIGDWSGWFELFLFPAVTWDLGTAARGKPLVRPDIGVWWCPKLHEAQAQY